MALLYHCEILHQTLRQQWLSMSRRRSREGQPKAEPSWRESRLLSQSDSEAFLGYILLPEEEGEASKMVARCGVRWTDTHCILELQLGPVEGTLCVNRI